MADEKSAPKKVKIKFLKYVGEYVPGQVAELSEDYAKQILKPCQVWDGEKAVDQPRAMLLEDAEKLEKAEMTEKELSKMTAADMAALGIKNIVVTPVDPVFEARMAGLKKLDEEQKAEAEAIAEVKKKKGSKKDKAEQEA